jgi:hypothetical protein
MKGTAEWSVGRVMALTGNAASQRAARGLATARPWPEAGWTDEIIWGLCKGSAKTPYQVCVDTREPAYRCSCPSRQTPCKHILGLLLRWVVGSLSAAEPPAWVHAWEAARTARAARAAAPRKTARAGPQRAARITGGLEELDRWLGDQVRGGLAGAVSAGYAHWDAMAARLVDAQAPAAAGAVRRLATAASVPERLLAELAMLRLLVSAHHRLAELPEPLAETVRGRVGYPVATADVLETTPVRDRWLVIGVREEADEQLTTRRVWLRGEQTGRAALVLSFAPGGQPLPVEFVLGTVADAELCFYPGARPLRALVSARHGPAGPAPAVDGSDVAAALREYAEALAADPWLDRWPVLLAAVTPVRTSAGGWWVRDGAGDAPPLAAGLPPWRLVAAAGGSPVTVAGEWTPDGLRPLTVWVEGRCVAC